MHKRYVTLQGAKIGLFDEKRPKKFCSWGAPTDLLYVFILHRKQHQFIHYIIILTDKILIIVVSIYFDETIVSGGVTM